MAILINAASVTGTGATRTSAPVDMTGANLIVFGTIVDFASAESVVDSLGNSYTSHGSSIVDPSLGTKGGLTSCINPVVSSSMTFSVACPGPANQSGVVMGFKTAVSFDSNNTGINGTGTSLTQNSITPSSAPALIFALWGKAGFAPLQSVDSGFTVGVDFDTSAGQWYGLCLAWKAQDVTPAAVAPKFTSTLSCNLSGQQTSFLFLADPIERLLWARSVL